MLLLLVKHQLPLDIRPVGRVERGSRGSNEPPLKVNKKTQTVDFQLLANGGGLENKLKLPCKKTLIVL